MVTSSKAGQNTVPSVNAGCCMGPQQTSGGNAPQTKGGNDQCCSDEPQQAGGAQQTKPVNGAQQANGGQQANGAQQAGNNFDNDSELAILEQQRQATVQSLEKNTTTATSEEIKFETASGEQTGAETKATSARTRAEGLGPQIEAADAKSKTPDVMGTDEKGNPVVTQDNSGVRQEGEQEKAQLEAEKAQLEEEAASEDAKALEAKTKADTAKAASDKAEAALKADVAKLGRLNKQIEDARKRKAQCCKPTGGSGGVGGGGSAGGAQQGQGGGVAGGTQPGQDGNSGTNGSGYLDAAIAILRVIEQANKQNIAIHHIARTAKWTSILALAERGLAYIEAAILDQTLKGGPLHQKAIMIKTIFATVQGESRGNMEQANKDGGESQKEKKGPGDLSKG